MNQSTLWTGLSAMALAGVLWVQAALAAPTAPAVSPEALNLAEHIYREGTLPGGAPLRGLRSEGVVLEGALAACVNCHRRSGLGEIEGGINVPPVTGDRLMLPAVVAVGDSSTPHAQRFASNRPAYDAAALARAIRDGVAPDGRAFSTLMPRYRLGESAMQALVGYLLHLGTGVQPGVEGDLLHFATIVTPEADPVSRDAMIAVLEKFFAQKNVLIGGASRPMRTARTVAYRVATRWQLHVWRLTGDPTGWGAQLDDYLRREPIVAVVSGIGGVHWQPVHAFCERQAVPCLFPNVQVPVVSERDFYPLYFSRGVLLEADLLAGALMLGHADLPVAAGARGSVRQIYRADDVGLAGASALADASRSGGRSVVSTALSGADGVAALRRAVAAAGPGDDLVLWLRPADLASLPEHPPMGAQVFVAGLMAGLESAPLPTAWRQVAKLSYPVDLPDNRRVRMNFPERWFQVARIPITDERIQVDTYIACAILSEAIGHMQDNFARDYLVERIENLLSHRLVNGYYPRLSLAPGQRFASKGGYLVRFGGPGPTDIVLERGWRTP